MQTLIIGAVIVVVVVWAIAVYNGLVTGRQRVRNAWSQIDVQLKRRHDLVPNLVAAVKGYMAHERQVLEEVTRARSAAVAAGNEVTARAEAENQLTRALRSLFAVSEAYPELKAGQNMLALQEELSSTENRIAFARQFYNDAVLAFNVAVQRFPANLVAGSLGFREEPMFELTDVAERAVPEVRFN